MIFNLAGFAQGLESRIEKTPFILGFVPAGACVFYADEAFGLRFYLRLHEEFSESRVFPQKRKNQNVELGVVVFERGHCSFPLGGLAVDNIDRETQRAQFSMAAQLVGAWRAFRLLVFHKAEIPGYDFLMLWRNRVEQNVIRHAVASRADKLQQQTAGSLVVLAVGALDC
ncbi:hypothetical protein BI380_02715 [Delftia tsuruhatensis]|uniref:Uncharacterized protein n=1 Tax=Delftia tsuruhatensis TaxID=180282 RepID=A0ABM6DZA5_9BURK|nr:hypothetical protein BI380_02715 [Delftia tsuruhatensis]